MESLVVLLSLPQPDIEFIEVEVCGQKNICYAMRLLNLSAIIGPISYIIAFYGPPSLQ
jgi:hypothetical protein